ncbi:MAG TPA: phosphate signaling complex protein PhoU [Desulfomonilaceae bacterium]|nr:phosphate signaling complex protein PhoU [Desulfomonilaceae bacterium]
MSVRLQRDVDKLKQRVIHLGALVEERFTMAMKSLEFKDANLAKKVIEGDIEIDHFEVDIEEECLKILALHQPVADHLRYLVAVLKMNNDLERIGDLAVNIAERAEKMIASSDIDVAFEYFTMAKRAGEMLKNSLDSLVNTDVDLAYRVCAADDDVDFMKSCFQEQFAQEICKSAGSAESKIDLFLVSRHLERIADHATNIAEDVIYMITGEIHRHRRADYI